MQTQQEIIRSALLLLLENPQGLHLFPSGQGLGLFPKTALGKQAAKGALSQDWISQKKTIQEGDFLFQVTSRGVIWLIDSHCVVPIINACLSYSTWAKNNVYENAFSPIFQVLKKLAREGKSLESSLNKFLLVCLDAWVSKSAGDCPLDRLFRLAQTEYPHLSIGAYHDALRDLAGKKWIELHPWTGPLYQIPAPELALLSGHEIGFYASLSPAGGKVTGQCNLSKASA